MQLAYDLAQSRDLERKIKVKRVRTGNLAEFFAASPLRGSKLKVD